MIAIGARAKVPGEAMAGEDVELNVLHQSVEEMDAYERLIGDAMKGDICRCFRARTVPKRNGEL